MAGVNYNKEDKKHSSRIEEWEKNKGDSGVSGMEIMEWVAKHVEKKSRIYYFSLIAFFGITFLLSVGKTAVETKLFQEEIDMGSWDTRWFWYFPWVGMIFAVICIWYYYAPIVCKDLKRLEGAFEGEGYRQLYGDYRGWMKQGNLLHTGKSRKFKVIYSVFWGMFAITFWIFSSKALDKAGFSVMLVIFFEALALAPIVLNYSSFYICIVFVYFLMCVYKLDQKEKLCHVMEIPSATYGFQVLSHTANTIYLYFLLDSLFCTVSYYCLWQIVFPKMSKMKGVLFILSFLYVTVFMIGLGLLSWAFIILLSRAYLYRLHEEWKLQYSEILEKKYQHAGKRDKKERILLAKEKLMQDKISIGIWEIIISFTTLAANLVTAGSIFGML